MEKGLASQATSANQRILPFVALGVVAALLLGLVAFLWWWNLPAQQFSYWHKTPSERPTQGGLCFVVDTITVNADGSGNISYILYNNGTEVDYWGSRPFGRNWRLLGGLLLRGQLVSGQSQPPTYIPLGVFSLNSVEPSQLESSTEALPAGTLAMPGRYRFCVENVGYVEFALFENGRFYDVLIGKGQQFW